MNTVTFFTITPLIYIDSQSKPSYVTQWAYCNEYLNDHTNNFYVLHAISCQIDLNATIIADASDAGENEYDHTDSDEVCGYRDDSVNNTYSVLSQMLSLLRYHEQETCAYGFDGSWQVYCNSR